MASWNDDDFVAAPPARDWRLELASVAGVEASELDAEAADIEPAADEQPDAVAPEPPEEPAPEPDAVEDSQPSPLEVRLEELYDLVVIIGTAAEQLGWRQLQLQDGVDALTGRADSLTERVSALTESVGVLADRPAAVPGVPLEAVAAVVERLAAAQDSIRIALEKLDERMDSVERTVERALEQSRVADETASTGTDRLDGDASDPRFEDPVDERRASIIRRLAQAQVQLTDSHAALTQSVHGMHHELMEIRAAMNEITATLLH
jgi:hypothetical protein